MILGLTASATGLQTTATAGKHDCETNLTGGGELGYVVLAIVKGLANGMQV